MKDGKFANQLRCGKKVKNADSLDSFIWHLRVVTTCPTWNFRSSYGSAPLAINLHFALKVLQARKVPPFINLLPAAKLWLRSGYLPTMKSIVPFQCQLRRHLTTAAMEIYVDPVMDLCK